MRTYFLILVLAVFTALALQDEEYEKEVIVKLVKFEECKDTNYPLSYRNVTMRMVGRNEMALSAVNVVEETVGENDDFIAETSVTKCDNEQQPDTCEPFFTKNIDMCEHLPEEGKLWSQLVNQTEGLNPYCPIAPGTYRIREAPVDMGDLQNQPILIGFWMIDTVGKSNGETVFCLHVEFTIKLKKQKKSE